MDSGSWKDFDIQAINTYRKYRQEVNGNAKELKWNDQELIIALGAAVEVKEMLKPTIAGILLFGTDIALRRLFPISSRIDYIIVKGREWLSNPEKRYSQCYEFSEALILAIPRIITHIMRDIPQAFSMQPNGIFRKNVPLIPDIVIREAVCNAVMHRDYSVGQAVQIVRYSNRIEFLNPGYSLKPEDQLGLPGSISRNEKIAGILHDLNIAETKGTGIRTMREAMKEANLSVPLFESDRIGNNFSLTLLSHHFFNKKDIQWLKMFSECNLSAEEARALIVVREMGAITNADYRNINSVDTLNASASLRRLREFGLLELKGKSSQTYYIPGKTIELKEITTSEIVALSTELAPNIKDLSTEITPNIRDLSTELEAGLPAQHNRQTSMLIPLPSDLNHELESIGQRTSPDKVKYLILKLCKVKPFKLPELAILLKRNAHYVRHQYLMPLIKSGKLVYVFPHQPNHPQQAYQTKEV